MPSKKTSNSSELDLVLAEIEKSYGKGSVMKLGQRPQVNEDVIPSGSLLINDALGIGGYPRGRIVEIYGPESSGKTTLALHAIAETQKIGGRAAFVDAEHSIDPVYAKSLGVDIDELILSQPDYGEQALEIVEKLANSGAFSLIVVDSVAALVPQAELEGEMIDSTVGLQARLMSKAMRKLAGILNTHKCTVIFLNQLRDKVGVMYGNPETTTGGKALKFFASIRLDIRRSEVITKGNEVKGNVVKIKIVKNKVAPPFKTCQVDIIYGQGISRAGELVDLGTQYGFLTRIGSWYEYEGNRLANGRDACKKYLEEHKELAKELEAKIVKHLKEQREE